MKVYDIIRKEDLPRSLKYYRTTNTIGNVWVSNLLLCRNLYIISDDIWPDESQHCYANWYKEGGEQWKYNKIWVKKSDYDKYSNHLEEIIAYTNCRLIKLWLPTQSWSRSGDTNLLKENIKPSQE